MQRRALGNSGLDVSVLALGTWAMGGAVESWGHVDDRESIATVHNALDLGINLIDTAPIYGLGHSEEVVGRAIHDRRDEVVLATKCGLLFPTSSDQLPPRCLAPESIRKQCDESLRRLRTDVIDLYQCHWPDPETPVRDTMEALTVLLDQGKIRAIGLSNFSCEQISLAREFGPVHALQPSFSMVQPRAGDDLIPFCVAHDMAVLPYSPLAKGLLTGKFSTETTFHDIRERDPDFIGRRYQRNLAMVASLEEIAARYDKTVTQLVVNWTAHFPGVTAPIVGAKRPSQIVESIGGIGWPLAQEDRQRIDRLVRGDESDA